VVGGPRRTIFLFWSRNSWSPMC